MSADIHKYGLGAKVRNESQLRGFELTFSPAPQGSSVVVYRNADIRRYQIFACSEWPGGLFGSPTLVGSRPGMADGCVDTAQFCVCVCVGGTIAASWAVLRCMGQEGYVEIARKLMEIADIMKTGINLIEVLCPPLMC